MEWTIVLAGLLVIGTGGALSWYKRGTASIWATYTFGFLLVLVGGPLRANLAGLSVTAKGVEATFKPVDQTTSPAKLAEIEGRARETLQSLSREQQKQATAPERQVIDEASESVINQLLPFVASLGFAPTQIVGSPKIEPGTILSFTNGRPTTIATSTEAFSKLNTQTSNVSIPRFSVARTVPGTQQKTVQVLFECKKGSQIVEASLSSLASSLNLSLIKTLPPAETYFVVQSILKCLEPHLASASESSNPGESSSQNYQYTGPEAILGYKLLAIGSEKPTNNPAS